MTCLLTGRFVGLLDQWDKTIIENDLHNQQFKPLATL
jgi:hypothetical protein